jgi:hypothetical protein
VHALIVMILILPAYSLTRKCPDYDRAAELMNTRNFVKASNDTRKTTGLKELNIKFQDINQAREYAFNFPALKEWGFMSSGITAAPYIGRLKSSAFHGKQTGWKFEKPNGDSAVIRLDWDPQKGAHYNISFTRHTPNGRESHRLALNFDCGARSCSEAEVLRMLDRINR